MTGTWALLSHVPVRSRVDYLLGGAAAGFAMSLLVLEAGQQDTTLSQLMTFGSLIAGGMFIGHELWRRRAWLRFGHVGDLARWVAAFATAAGVLASILLVNDRIDGPEQILVILSGAALGMAAWVAMARQKWMEGNAGVTPADLRRIRLALLLLSVVFAILIVIGARLNG